MLQAPFRCDGHAYSHVEHGKQGYVCFGNTLRLFLHFHSYVAYLLRYSPAMSRNAAAHDAADESFASLLEHLTRHAGPRAAKPKPDVYFESSAGSNLAAHTASSARAGIRPLLPVTGVKARSKADQDAEKTDEMQLSYEKALRMHRRHKPASESGFELTKMETPSDGGNKTAGALSGSSTQHSDRSQRKPKQKKTFNRAKKSSPESRSNSSSGSRLRKEAQCPVIFETIASQSKALTGQSRKIQSPDLKLDWELNQLDRLNPIHQLAQLIQPDQKRAIVSVRLTDSELATLRNRADESGISVSAYMRSCVLDAENLRAQVKQALAEMRSVGEKPEPVRLPSLVAPEDTRPANRSTWSQMISKSAAFLLGPLFSFGRSV
jgi:hypothetical protein